jgi:hypothetical protein
MDAEISKQAQKILQKQGLKFKLNTKVTSGDDSGEGVKIEVEAAKGGKNETVSPFNIERYYISLTRFSLMPMSASSLLDGDPTPQVLASRISV